MINNNGAFHSADTAILANNRAFLYGDGVFETVKVRRGSVLFLEDHYFRLMSAMRILRMEIPMEFTMEFLSEQLLAAAAQNNLLDSARVRITVYRNDGGAYLPTTQSVSFVIAAAPLATFDYVLSAAPYEVELYKDFYITRQLLSTLKSTNKIINVTGSIFAKENGYSNCLLLNDAKNVVEALNGNLFMLNGSVLTTPPLTEGCLNGVMRKQIIAIAPQLGLEISQQPISPFDLQKADELFISNVIIGVQPITKYRKKEYQSLVAQKFIATLNEVVGS